MRVVALVLLASGALTIGAAGSASAGCYRDCDDHGYYAAPTLTVHRHSTTIVSHETVSYERPYYRSHHKPYRFHGCRSYRSHGYGCRPALIYGGPWSYRGPVYASTGHYHYGPYVSHRAVFGFGGCRTAYLTYGPTWQLASNC